MSNIIVPLHAFTRCDCVSGFFGHSKKSIFDKAGEYIDVLANLGRRLNVTKELTDNLDKFTVRVIYNDRNSKTLAEARAKKGSCMVKKGTLRLAPDKDYFNQHLNGENYQAHIWLHYNNPPGSPLPYGWEIKSDIMVPVMYTTPALPTDINNMLHTVPGMDSEHSRDSSDEERIVNI